MTADGIAERDERVKKTKIKKMDNEVRRQMVGGLDLVGWFSSKYLSDFS